LLFNSFEFPVFLGLVLLVYHLLGHRAQNRWLLVASYVFYGWWDWRFLSLIALSTLVDYFCSLGIAGTDDAKRRLRLLRLSLCTNLGILGFFKYFDFFADSTIELLATLGVRASAPLLEVVLPIGISFYTFQTMAYTIDVWRGQVSPTRNLFDFALYVAFFPQLVAGPIERARQLLPQIENPRRVGREDLSAATQLILLGFFKKLVIADGFAPYVDRAFNDPGAHSAAGILLAIYLFAFQIYADFSGYTDIARGSARLLGIRLSVNFRQPYLSASISEFWRRWHVTLSSWLRDYLYIPLGGSQRGRVRTYRNLFLTMLLGGLWHGAAWHFIVWGGLHGVALAVHRMATGLTVSSVERERKPGPLRQALGIVVTFHLVCLLWVPFRADNLGSAVAVLAGLSGDWTLPALAWTIPSLLAILCVLALDLSCWRKDRELPIPETWPAPLRGALYALLILAFSFIGTSNVRPFIYFQF
jgi:alginate O-acetyltransferase complex protein AlgI